MLFFGHTGITFGAGFFIAGLAQRYSRKDVPTSEKYSQPDSSPVKEDLKTDTHSSFFISLTRDIDLRLLIIGSMLPDIIDKPLGHLLFRETISNGRIFCHTALFLIMFSSPGLFIYRRSRHTGLLVLAFGILVHLILDQMWSDYHMLAWSILGIHFEMNDISSWISDMLNALFKEPQTYIPEIIGIIIIGLFVYWLISKRQLFCFVRTGKVLPG